MSAATAAPARLVLGGEPRVQLLPPEVMARRRQQGQVRRFLLFLALVVALVALGWTYSAYFDGQAQAGLVSAQGETQALTVERQKYAEASTATGLIASIQQTQVKATADEVIWADVMGHIDAGMPAGSSVTAATMNGPAPWETPLASAGLFGASTRIATLSLTVASPSLPDATTLVRSLAAIPGYAGASIQSSTVQSDKTYQTVFSLDLNDQALANRFAKPKPAAKTTTTEAGQ